MKEKKSRERKSRVVWEKRSRNIYQMVLLVISTDKLPSEEDLSRNPLLRDRKARKLVDIYRGRLL